MADLLPFLNRLETHLENTEVSRVLVTYLEDSQLQAIRYCTSSPYLVDHARGIHEVSTIAPAAANGRSARTLHIRHATSPNSAALLNNSLTTLHSSQPRSSSSLMNGAMAPVCASGEFPNTDIVSWTLSGDYDPTKPVLIDASDTRRWISKERAISLIVQLTGAFVEDSTVCLHLANDITYPILCMAIFASKCRWTGTNTAYTAPELEHHFRVSQTKYVITDKEHLPTVRAAVQSSGTRATIIVYSDLLSDRPHSHPAGRRCSCSDHLPELSHQMPCLHDLLNSSNTEHDLVTALRRIDVTAVATLMSTSGTTGKPKMAARTHLATVAETVAAADNHAEKDYEVRRLFCTPIFHAFSTPEMIINSLRLGLPSYFMKRFHNDMFPKNIWLFKITETFAPPPMLAKLIENPDAGRLASTLRTVYTGGAPLSQELRLRFLNKLSPNPPRVAQVWGMTEGGWFAHFKYPVNDETGSVGYPLPGFEIKIKDENRYFNDANQEVGEVLVRGPDMMSHYWDNPEASAGAFEHGWLKTGDIGYINDAKVYLVDRGKDLIKVNGWQVAPAEIEDALLKSSAVQDCGVIGFGEGIDEHPLAFVVLADDAVGTTVEVLKQHLLQRLTRYKVSSCDIRFVDSIPKSVSGKILKTHLRIMAREA